MPEAGLGETRIAEKLCQDVVRDGISIRQARRKPVNLRRLFEDDETSVAFTELANYLEDEPAKGL